jgi:hypothetical protein
MVLGDKPYTGSFYFNAVSVLEGKGIYADEGFDHPELGSMRGLNLMSFDPNLNIIHWYTIDDRGTCHDHLGYWTDDNTFYAQYQGIVEGKIYVEKIYFSFENNDRISFRLVGEMNGIVSESMSGIFKKSAQK